MGNACAYDMTSATARTAMRNAIHNILYSYVNSNLVNGMAPGSMTYYDMSPWEKGLIAADVVLGLLAVAGVVWILLRTQAAKKHPEQYVGTAEGNAIYEKSPEDQKRQRTQTIIILVIVAVLVIAAVIGGVRIWNWYDGLMRG